MSMILDLQHLIGLGQLQILQGDLRPISSGELEKEISKL